MTDHLVAPTAELLAELDDAPPLLFVEGDPALLERPQLAMVGSRRASRTGLDTACAFARSLAGGGFVVTSGLALGIDGAAHQGALEVGGATVAVLGTGLERGSARARRAGARTQAPAHMTQASSGLARSRGYLQLPVKEAISPHRASNSRWPKFEPEDSRSYW